MKKRRNTKYKVNNPVRDIIVTILLLILAALCMKLFLISYFRTDVRDDKNIVGSITFKKNTVQRKNNDRVVWDRPNVQASIYDGDTVATSSKSGAAIHSGSSKINLEDNTMIQIFIDEDGRVRLDLATGKIEAVAGDHGMIIINGDQQIVFNANSSVQASRSEESSTFILQSGSARIITASGEIIQAQQGETVAINTDGEIKQQKILIATSPSENTRLYSYDGNGKNIFFQHADIGSSYGEEDETAVVEIASDSGFRNIIKSSGMENGFCTEQLDCGNYFWRMKFNDQSMNGFQLPQGYIQIVDAGKANPVEPADNASYSYRVRKPEVNFKWTAKDNADKYILQFSRDSSFEDITDTKICQTNSYSTTQMAEGTTWWRVKPVYEFDTENQQQTYSQGRRIRLTKENVLTAPALRSPENHRHQNLQTTENVTFKWTSYKDALYYTIEIAKDRNFTSIVKKEKTTSPSFVLKNASAGRYYWRVSTTDQAGTSPYSPSRTLYCSSGQMKNTLLYPVNGYSISKTSSRDTEFRFNSSEPLKTTLQISTSQNFSQSYEFNVTGKNSFKPELDFNEGTCYWRIVTKDDEDVNVVSPVGSFKVMTRLAQPDITSPAENQKIDTETAEEIAIEWQPVTDAQAYSVLVKQGRNVLFSDSHYTQTQVKLKPEDFKEDQVHVEVQALAAEDENGQARDGLKAERNFETIKVIPVTLKNPENEFTTGGIEARTLHMEMSWTTAKRSQNVVFVLTDNEDDLPENYQQAVNLTDDRMIVVKTSDTKTKLPVLEPGEYFWKVYAVDSNGFDISSKEYRKYNVKKIPPLEDIVLLSPEDGKAFTWDEVVETEFTAFAFSDVKDATEYKLTVTNKADGKVIAEKSFRPQDKKELDINLFDTFTESGNFEWTVTAKRVLEDGEIIQESTPASRTFSVDIEDEIVDALDGMETTDLYGGTKTKGKK